MDFRLFKDFIIACNKAGIEPTWIGLKTYKDLFRK